MNRPPKAECGRAFVGDLRPPGERKTRARGEGGTKKGRFYRPLPPRFRHNGFDHAQIAREGNAAIYEQRWTGCAKPSVCYEVVRIRRRDGFQIGEKFIGPYEVYPDSNAWGVDGFTFSDSNKARDKFFEISLEEPAKTGKEVN
jgi:hypothetical protein